MLNNYVFVYLDDILISSTTMKKLVHHIQTALQRLLKNSLWVKVEKCKFHVSSISFLSLIVLTSDEKMRPHEAFRHTAKLYWYCVDAVSLNTVTCWTLEIPPGNLVDILKWHWFEDLDYNNVIDVIVFYTVLFYIFIEI